MNNQDINNTEYKYGFTTEIENIKAPKGLTEQTIKFIPTRVELDLALFNEDIWSH